MTTKTIKIVLFASLIAAMILPFSGMSLVNAEPNENASDKGKEKATRTYEVEVLSSEILEESVIDGVKVTKIKQLVRQTHTPTMKEFLEDNKEYFDFLIEKQGKPGRDTVGKAIAEFAQNQANAPEEYEIEVIKYGEHSITFEPKTRDGPGTGYTIKDPINIVFWGDGRASEAKSKIDNNAPHSWHSGLGGWQYVYIDETAHGGTAHWQLNNFQLEEGSYSDRYHLRIFDGGQDTHSGGFNYWSVGAVHRENCTPSCHTLYSNSWEQSESHLKSDLSSTSGILSVGTINLSNSGYYQGIWNGGVAGLIKVQ